MGTSDPEQISNVMNLITQMRPVSVLDIGVGFGKMGLLCREYLDIWWGRYLPDEWRTRIDGIEVFPNNRNPIHDYCYNEIIYDNVMNHLDSIGNYQLVLMIDVIEHLSKDDGARLLDAIRNFYIVTTPRTFSCEGRIIRGNTHESHISRWYPSEFPKSLLLGRQFIAWRDTMENAVITEPKQAQKIHFALTSAELTYPCYLSVVSALKTQKATEVVLWALSEPKGKYFPLLKDRVRLEIVPKPDFPALRDKDEHFQCAHLKDYFEWKILYKHGGMFLDLDTFCLKDVTHLNSESSKELVLADEIEKGCSNYPFFNIAILMSKPHSVIIAEMLASAVRLLTKSDGELKWGDTGSHLLMPVVKQNLDKIKVLEYGTLGGAGVGQVSARLYQEKAELWDQARILHLFGKSFPQFASFTEEYIRDSNILFARIVRNTLEAKEWGPFLVTKKLTKQGSLEELKRHKVFHLLGLPHIPTNKVEGLACAYSQKVLKMAKMLKSLGHTVFFYGVEGSDGVECDEFIQVSTKEILKKAYGDYDWRVETFKHNMNDIAYKTFHENTIREISKRKQATDFLLLPWSGSKAVYDALAPRLTEGMTDQERAKANADPDKLYLSVEMGIGYGWTISHFRVFESYAWMHHVYGLTKQYDGLNYDVVIPNYFDHTDFQYCEDKDDYYLYLGRVIACKGIVYARETVEAIGAKLLVAGQDDGTSGELKSPNIEYVGFADHAKRKKLLSKAKALFVPTIYVEPFGGVSIEAAFSGTPVITTDWGCFTENVLHGKTGFRCRTKDQFTWAAKNIDRIKPADCYKWAMDNFTLDRVKLMYEEYFNMLLDVKAGNGWYQEHPERTQLDWLNRTYPSHN